MRPSDPDPLLRPGAAVRGPRPRETPERCAIRAQLRDDPLLGTAFPAGRLLLVEQPGPWGMNGLVDSRFGRDEATELGTRAARAGLRLQVIRRPGRTPAEGERRWAVVDTRDDLQSITWSTYHDPKELLDAPLDASVGVLDARPIYLVCAHSKHDACCALRGRHVAAALDSVRPGQVWECSHLGGDRFAANVLVLPTGLLYGRVLTFAAPGLVAATERGEVIGGLLRGRIGMPPPAQAALAFAHDHLALTRVDEVRLISVGKAHDSVVPVRLSARGAPIEVTVRMERRNAAGLTCRQPGPSSYVAYRPVALQPV